MVYRERLLPPWWLWSAVAAFAAMVAVAYGYAWGVGAAIGSALVVGVGLGALLVATSSVVAVDDRVVRAGRARFPAVGGADPALGPRGVGTGTDQGLRPGAYTLLRTWASGRAVRIQVTDPDDPHPTWLISTRDPDALAAAIRRQSAAFAGLPLPGAGRVGPDPLEKEPTVTRADALRLSAPFIAMGGVWLAQRP